MFSRNVLSLVLVLGCTAAAAQGRQGLANLEQADTNKDGSISKAEYLEARAQQFAKFDRNSDGYIDDADMPTRTEGQPQRGRRAAQLRAQLDANADGKISKAEFVDAPAPAFERADADRNGVLTTQELEAVRGKVRERAERRKPDAGA